MSAPEFRQGLVSLLPNLKRFGMVLSRNPSQADDLVQATCARALSRADQFEAGTKLESWLFSIMHSIWKNELRKRATAERLDPMIPNRETAVDGERVAQGKIMLSHVLSKLGELPEEQAAALSLVSLEGFAYKEAAEVLDIPIGTVESRVARARIALGRLVAGEMSDMEAKKRTGEDRAR